MAPPVRYLVDTNVLLRLSRENDPEHGVVQRAVGNLVSEGAILCFSLQNVAEFWNVCTRPAHLNGYGLSKDETSRRVRAIEQTMTLLPDSEKVYEVWRTLVNDHDVRGVQVHDARLIALMRVYGVPCILTFNQGDFTRYGAERVVHPRQC
jgi:predicted nucleic acid-binding protein